MKTDEICLACGGELKPGDILHGRCETCREKGIPASPKIVKAQEKEILRRGKTANFSQKSDRLNRILSPMEIVLIVLAVICIGMSALDKKTLAGPIEPIFLGIVLITALGFTLFGYMTYSWFSNSAKSEGRNGVGWGLIGVLSIILPARLYQSAIFPIIIKGRVTVHNVNFYQTAQWMFAIIIGVVCALLARRVFASRILPSMKR